MIRFAQRLPTAIGLAVAVVVLALGPPARADLVLTLSNGTQSFTADDNNGTITTSPTGGAIGTAQEVSPGVLLITASLGGFQVNVSTATGAPAIGDPSSAKLDLNNLSLAYNGTAGGQLTLTAYQTGDTVSPGYPIGTLSSDFGGTTTNMQLTSAQAWYDATNTGSTSGLYTAFNPAFSSTSGSFSQSSSTSVPLNGGPFALVEQIVLTANQGVGATSFDMMTAVSVPEPTSMMAAFTAMPFLALSAWLRRRKPVAIA
jgi:hypothetical protein